MMRRLKHSMIFGTMALLFGGMTSLFSCQSTQPVNECHSCSDAQVCCYLFIYSSVDPDSGRLQFSPDAADVLNATCGTLIDGGPGEGVEINGTLDGATGQCSLGPPE